MIPSKEAVLYKKITYDDNSKSLHVDATDY